MVPVRAFGAVVLEVVEYVGHAGEEPIKERDEAAVQNGGHEHVEPEPHAGVVDGVQRGQGRIAGAEGRAAAAAVAAACGVGPTRRLRVRAHKLVDDDGVAGDEEEEHEGDETGDNHGQSG